MYWIECKCKVINILVISNKVTGTPPNILVISNERECPTDFNWAPVSHSSQMITSVPLISNECEWARVSHSFQLRPSVPLISNISDRPTHLKWARASHSSVWIFLHNSINVFWGDTPADVTPCLGIGIADNFLGIASSNERYFLGISSSYRLLFKNKTWCYWINYFIIPAGTVNTLH